MRPARCLLRPGMGLCVRGAQVRAVMTHEDMRQASGLLVPAKGPRKGKGTCVKGLSLLI